ncbi:MAG: methionine adenosyltransferase [Lachnospiraceae bacterium]|nr:methionine adenosyltransferase [Lachnospiraceae bacterium]
MNNGNYVFTSESVTEGHPDKVCDQISDAVLTHILNKDKTARVACECFAGKDFLLISGEVTSRLPFIDYEMIARETIRKIGYTDMESPFNSMMPNIFVKVNTQSPDIAQGVDIGGAGDQGIMFGYASNDTKELMPAPIQFAHSLTKKLAEVRKRNFRIPFKPDGKSQVTVKYDSNNKVIGIDTVLISTQHFDGYTQNDIRDLVISEVINPTLGNMIDANTKILVNPTGKFVIGGPEGDTGLTGRKIIVDTYGGMGRHGGGCFSGKDPTKVDRSAAYMARFLAKKIVRDMGANRCEVQLAYAIGVPEPVSIHIDTFGDCNDRHLEEVMTKMYDLTPKGIITFLDLLNVDYTKLASYGHMGRNELGVKWEIFD